MTRKVAVVTGGSQGLGFAIASELVDAGYHVAIVSRRQDALDDACARLGGEHVTGIAADISAPDQIPEIFAKVDMIGGELAVMVNNAAVYVPFPIDDARDEWVLQTINLNFVGTVLCTREAIKRMKRSGTGDVVNITSDSASFPFPLLSVYGGTKAAVEQFTKTVNTELRQTDIRLTAARVGRMHTEGGQGIAQHEHIAEFVAAMDPCGATFQSGQGMQPASTARTIAAMIAAPRDTRPIFVEIMAH